MLSAQLEPNRKFDRNRTYDPLFTCPDTLPLSYTRLVEATATKLESSDKHSSYSYDWNINMSHVMMTMMMMMMTMSNRKIIRLLIHQQKDIYNS